MIGTLTRRDRVVTVVAALAVGALAAFRPGAAGPVLVLAAAGLLGVALALADPAAAMVLLLTGAFLRGALHDEIPDVPVSGILILAGGLGVLMAVGRGALRVPRPGAVEFAMGLYLLLNVVSWLVPHELPALTPQGGTLSVLPFVVTGVAMPFALYAVGRAAGTSARLIRVVLWWIVGATAYSAITAVFQFHGPAALVWPRFIVTAPTWRGRAVGIFDQPVTNGMLLLLGIVVCLWFGGRTGGPGWQRWTARGVALVATYAVYLTHTRAAWLATAVVLACAALLAPGYRRGALTLLGLGVTAAVANWTAFTGSNRYAGGVGSSSEIVDRLNLLATAARAIVEKPFFGWGVGRFIAFNQRFHAAWSARSNWSNGYGIASHQTELGIAVELGLLGLAAWLAALVLLVRRLLRAHRRGEAAQREIAGIALLAMAALVVNSATVDLRYLDFAGALVFLLAGLALGARPASAPASAGNERQDLATTPTPGGG